MNSTPAVPVRTCVAIVNQGEICLIHRHRADGDQYSLPGGLLDPEEQIPAALARELKEELDLDTTALPCDPDLRWVLDQATRRPGSHELFRRLHLVHVLHAPDHVRNLIAAAEQDAKDTTRVLWIPLAEAADLHLYPAVGPALAGLAGLANDTSTMTVQLPPMLDHTYTWR
ncbi:NUDIX hydrolase [Streptomyces goshikiensis]|uniref:NUDIX hydrolase n=1 Tax=Streptomyces goshikiensis TaxID=1942 RepID=UPI003684852C